MRRREKEEKSTVEIKLYTGSNIFLIIYLIYSNKYT